METDFRVIQRLGLEGTAPNSRRGRGRTEGAIEDDFLVSQHDGSAMNDH